MYPRWVDYSDKYGLGYELSDKSFGMLFNDNVSLLQTIQSDIYHTIDFRLVSGFFFLIQGSTMKMDHEQQYFRS